jgi:hypothetical protein
MYFGGWSYPDAALTGADGAGAALNAGEPDCAARGAEAAQANSAPARRDLKAFWTDIRFLRFSSPAKAHIQDAIRGFELPLNS